MSFSFRRTPTPESAAPGDLAAFNRLVLAHQEALYNCAYRLLGDEAAAAEVTQAAFLTALRERPAGSGTSLRVWLLRCLVRACETRLRATPGVGAAVPQRVPADAWSIQQCLASLPPDLRLVLALVDVAGLDYLQVATVLDLSHGQVRQSLALARQALLRGLSAGPAA